MRLRNLFYLLLALPLAFAACDDTKEVDEIKDPVLTLTSQAVVEFSAEEATGEITYTLENPVEGKAVTASANVDWITDITVSDKVTFTVAANEVAEAREGKITVEYTTLNFEVTVKQAAKVFEPELTLVAGDGAEYEAAGGEGAIEYEIKNAVEGTELKAEADAAWVTDVKVVAAESKVTYKVSANDKSESRSAKITLSYGELKVEATVKQKPYVEEGKPALSLKSEAKVNFTAEGGAGVIEYELINPDEETTLSATTAADWVKDVTVVAADSKVTFNVEANATFEARESKIVVAYGDLKFEVSVSQEAKAKPELALKSEAVKEFTAEGGNGEFAFELKNAVDGTELKAEAGAAWVTDVTVVAADSKVTYKVAANESEDARETKVTLSYGDLKVEVAVKQAGVEAEEPEATLTIKSGAELSFEAAGGDGVVEYLLENATEGAEVKASTEAAWISDVKVVAADSKVTFKVAANDTTEAREAKVVLSCGELKAEATVKQAAGEEQPGDENAAEIKLKSPQTVTAQPNGGSGIIGYELVNPVEGAEVVATTTSDWISIGEIDTEKCRVNYNVAETDTKEERSGVITLTYVESEVKVIVKQKGGVMTFEVLAGSPIEIDYTQQTVIIPYKIKFAEEGTQVSATVEYLSPEGVTDWITNIKDNIAPAEPEQPETPSEPELAAEESSAIINGYISYDVAENAAEGNRTAKITVTCGDKTWTQEVTQFDNYPDDVVMDVTEVYASARTGSQGAIWDLVLVEKDRLLGTPYTRITVAINPANVQYINSDTYTKYNGRKKKGIQLGNITESTPAYVVESNSVYRYNTSAASAITECELTIEVNETTETAKISGKFISQQYNAEKATWNDVAVTFEYDDAVRGFLYVDPTLPVTEWASFGISYSGNEPWAPNHTFTQLSGKSQDGNTNVQFDLYVFPRGEKNSLATGTYTLAAGNVSGHYCDTSSSKINNISLVSGSVTIEDDAAGYKLTYDVVDGNGTNLKGTYVGALDVL